MKLHTLLFFAFFALLLSCAKEKHSAEAALKMQEFVINISDYARGIDPDFIIIPQNGEELAFNANDINQGLNTAYMSAIDGFGAEEVFYNGDYSLDNYRLSMLQTLGQSKKIMVSDFVKDNNNIADARLKNQQQGFISFVRNSNNYYYQEIPDTVVAVNSNDITSLAQAQNYLYLINSENYSTKQDFINAIAATNFDVLLIDLFFGEDPFSISEINQLKTKANGGKRLVIAYMNIGSAEKYRYYWQHNWHLHNPNWLKKKYAGYADEIWVNFWVQEWQDIIYGNDNSYLKKILDAAFDGVYLDNVEAYYFLYHHQ